MLSVALANGSNNSHYSHDIFSFPLHCRYDEKGIQKQICILIQVFKIHNYYLTKPTNDNSTNVLPKNKAWKKQANPVHRPSYTHRQASLHIPPIPISRTCAYRRIFSERGVAFDTPMAIDTPRLLTVNTLIGNTPIRLIYAVLRSRDFCRWLEGVL